MVVGAVRDWKARRAAEQAEVVRRGEIVRRLHWRCWDFEAPAPDVAPEDVVVVLTVLINNVA